MDHQSILGVRDCIVLSSSRDLGAGLSQREESLGLHLAWHLTDDNGHYCDCDLRGSKVLYF